MAGVAQARPPVRGIYRVWSSSGRPLQVQVCERTDGRWAVSVTLAGGRLAGARKLPSIDAAARWAGLQFARALEWDDEVREAFERSLLNAVEPSLAPVA